MPFPQSKRVIFAQNTIVEVICQLRFPPILKIAGEPVAFQDILRREYPFYERQEVSAFPPEIQEIVSRLDIPKVSENVAHRLKTADGKRSITLTKDFVAVSETSYVRWENLRSQVSAAMAAVESVYAPAFYVRTGLRYRNIIDKAKLGLADASWMSLINAGFVGILSADEVATQISRLQSLAMVNLGPQLPSASANVRYGIEGADGNRFVIDSDLFTEERKEAPDVLTILDQFNLLNGNLFRWALGGTGPLWDAMGPVPVD